MLDLGMTPLNKAKKGRRELDALLENTPQGHPLRSQLDAALSQLDLLIDAWGAQFDLSSAPSPLPTAKPLYSLLNYPEVPFEAVPKKATPLGKVHFQLGKAYATGTLPDREHEIDLEGACFHFRLAADSGFVYAQLQMANLYANMPRAELVDLIVPENWKLAHRYGLLAAERGSRVGMIKVAKALLDPTISSQAGISPSAAEAVRWYQEAISTERDDSCGSFEAAYEDFELWASVAELYRNGGEGLPIDLPSAASAYRQAADAAIEAMKGRTASRFFSLAEEIEASLD